MAETTYTYNITNDLPSGSCNPGKLHIEIDASSIVTSLLRVDTTGGIYNKGQVTGGTLNITFADALSAGEKTTLDGDLANPAGGLLASNDNTTDSNIFEVSSVEKTSTTSSSFVVIPGMEVTPDAGTYTATFSGTVTNDSRSKSVQVALFKGETQITHSNRTFIRGNQQQSAPFSCKARVTVTGSDTISARWKVETTSSGSITERSLILEPE